MASTIIARSYARFRYYRNIHLGITLSMQALYYCTHTNPFASQATIRQKESDFLIPARLFCRFGRTYPRGYLVRPYAGHTDLLQGCIAPTRCPLDLPMMGTPCDEPSSRRTPMPDPVQLSIEGMTCAGCAKAVTRAFVAGSRGDIRHRSTCRQGARGSRARPVRKPWPPPSNAPASASSPCRPRCSHGHDGRSPGAAARQPAGRGHDLHKLRRAGRTGAQPAAKAWRRRSTWRARRQTSPTTRRGPARTNWPPRSSRPATPPRTTSDNWRSVA